MQKEGGQFESFDSSWNRAEGTHIEDDFGLMSSPILVSPVLIEFLADVLSDIVYEVSDMQMLNWILIAELLDLCFAMVGTSGFNFTVYIVESGNFYEFSFRFGMFLDFVGKSISLFLEFLGKS